MQSTWLPWTPTADKKPGKETYETVIHNIDVGPSEDGWARVVSIE